MRSLGQGEAVMNSSEWLTVIPAQRTGTCLLDVWSVLLLSWYSLNPYNPRVLASHRIVDENANPNIAVQDFACAEIVL